MSQLLIKLVLVIGVLDAMGLEIGIRSLFIKNLLRIWRHLRILWKTGMVFLTNTRCVNTIKYWLIILSDQRPIIKPYNICVELVGALSYGFQSFDLELLTATSQIMLGSSINLCRCFRSNNFQTSSHIRLMQFFML